jgi:hypothetical protein
VERALALGESPPESSSVQRRHAWLSLVASLAAWGLFLLGGLVLLTIYSAHPTAVLNLTGSVLLLSSFIIGLFALGQGTAGIRERGPRMRVATTGAVLAGVQIGVMVGFLFLNLWHN